MSLKVEHTGEASQTFYFVLFDAINQESAYSDVSNSFEPFIKNDGNFIFFLNESNNRSGYYSNVFSDSFSIPQTENDAFYTIEKYQMLGSSPDRDADSLVEVEKFYWDGDKRISLSKSNNNLITAQDIPNNLDLIESEFENAKQIISSLEEKVLSLEEAVNDLKNFITNNPNRRTRLPATQTPRFGPPGSSAGNGGINFNPPNAQ